MSKLFSRILNRIYTILLKFAGASIGKGSVVFCNCSISRSAGLSIREKSTIYKRCSFYFGKEGSFSMGEHSHMAPYGYVLTEKNHLSIGNDVAIGPYCSFFLCIEHN